MASKRPQNAGDRKLPPPKRAPGDRTMPPANTYRNPGPTPDKRGVEPNTSRQKGKPINGRKR